MIQLIFLYTILSLVIVLCLYWIIRIYKDFPNVSINDLKYNTVRVTYPFWLIFLSFIIAAAIFIMYYNGYVYINY